MAEMQEYAEQLIAKIKATGVTAAQWAEIAFILSKEDPIVLDLLIQTSADVFRERRIRDCVAGLERKPQ